MRSPTRLATWSEGRGGPLRGYITTGAAPWWYPRRNGRGRGPVDDPASQRQGDWRGLTESIDPNCIPVEGGRPSPTLSAPGRSGQSPTSLHNHPSVPIPRSSNPARYGVRGGGAGGNADAVGDYDIRSDLVAQFRLGEAAGAARVLVGQSGWLMSDRGPMARTVPKWWVSRRDRPGSRSQQPSGRLSRATGGGGCRDGDRIDGVRVCALALRGGSAERPRPGVPPSQVRPL
jgi:hypothetical protein